jgi:hypothetical protein
VASSAFDGQQVAAVGGYAVFDEFPVQYSVTVTASVSRGDGRLRIGIYDTVAQRYDVVTGVSTTSTGLATYRFTSSSLAHVDRDRRLWLEVIAEFGPGSSELLRVDHIGVTWRR